MAKSTTSTTTTTQRNPEATHSIQHIEIVSTEPVKMRRFLEKQFAWKFETMKMGTGGDYHSFRTPDGNGGGVLAPQGGQPVAATPYINVEDCERSLRSCQKLGAEIVMPVTEVPGMGKFFWFRYPGGPPLACWQATSPPR